MRSNPIGDTNTPSRFATLRPESNGFPTLSVETSALLQMRLKVVEALNRLPRRGLEIGGLLVGHLETAPSGAPAIYIEEFVPVEIAHEWGPSYRLSEAETLSLQREIQATRENLGSPGSVLGWWRSDTLGLPLAPRPEDDATFRLLFGRVPALLLLFRPHTFDPFVCQMSVLEGGTIYASEEFPVEFSESAAHVAVERPEDRPETRPETMERRPEGAAEYAKPEYTKPEYRKSLSEMVASHAMADSGIAGAAGSPRITPPIRLPSPRAAARMALAGLMLLCVVAAAIVGLRLLQSADTPTQIVLSQVPDEQPKMTPEVSTNPAAQAVDKADNTLPLQARSAGDALRLTWNPGDLERATSATLTIQDGNAETRLTLDSAEIQNGSATYNPRSGTIRVDAVFSGPGYERHGALQVIVATPKSKASSPVRDQGMPVAVSRPRAFDTRPIRTDARSERRPAPAIPAAPPVESGRPDVKDLAPTSSLSAEALPPAPRDVGTTTRQTSSQAVATPTCQVSVQTLAYYEPRSRFGFLRALGKLPLIPGGEGATTGEKFAGPALIDKRCPDLRALRLVHRPETLDFLVKLNASGSVDKVEATGPQQYTLVAEQARRAMANWHFRPARVGEKSVESELRVTMAMRYPPL